MSTDRTARTRRATTGRSGPSSDGRNPLPGRLVRGLGELLVTIGVLLVLFVVWQLWWTNLGAGAAQREAVSEIARDFSGSPEVSGARAGAPERSEGTRAERTGAPGADERAGSSSARPPVAAPPGDGQPLGIVYVPRFGENYARPVMEGTSREVLDTLGLGHYTSSAMPGEIGNFAVAGHRQTNGKVLDLIHTLVPGDRIHVRTAEGYYTYVFRSSEIVHPSESRVLAPVPDAPGTEPTESLLTLTSCHPRFGSTERFIAYAVLQSWRPAAAGPPADIAHTVAALERS